MNKTSLVIEVRNRDLKRWGQFATLVEGVDIQSCGWEDWNMFVWYILNQLEGGMKKEDFNKIQSSIIESLDSE